MLVRKNDYHAGRIVFWEEAVDGAVGARLEEAREGQGQLPLLTIHVNVEQLGQGQGQFSLTARIPADFAFRGLMNVRLFDPHGRQVALRKSKEQPSVVQVRVWMGEDKAHWSQSDVDHALRAVHRCKELTVQREKLVAVINQKDAQVMSPRFLLAGILLLGAVRLGTAFEKVSTGARSPQRPAAAVA